MIIRGLAVSLSSQKDSIVVSSLGYQLPVEQCGASSLSATHDVVDDVESSPCFKEVQVVPNNIHTTECLSQASTSSKAAFSWKCSCNAQQRAQDVGFVEAMGLKDVNDVVEFANCQHLGQFDVSALHRAVGPESD